jgi:histidinol-phosphate aminotransferase
MQNTQLSQRIRQDIQSMQAYAIQNSAGLVKLDAMENPFSLPPHLQHDLGVRLGHVAVNRYPAGNVAALQAALASYAQMPPDCSLMLGNGSDELISLLALACDLPGAAILSPVPGFVMYEMSAKLQGLQFVGVPLTRDFELDEAAMLAAIAQHKPAITYIAYPNNPTANLWNDTTIENIITACKAIHGLVVMDEAYQPFASRSYLQRLTQHSHVLLMRTLSKFGLAGVRLGYMMGPSALIAEVDKVRPPYNISALNAEAALFALEHAQVFAEQAAVLCSERERLQQALRTMSAVMPELRAYPSEANMILVRVPEHPGAEAVFNGMKQRGVLIKNVSKLHALLHNCIRLTVGTPQENMLMLRALEGALQI